jgi:hypothetical protein
MREYGGFLVPQSELDRVDTLYLTLFSAVFGVTYAFRLSSISSYGWRLSLPLSPWDWNYSVAGLAMYILPVLAAGIFISTFSSVHRHFEGKFSEFVFLVYVFTASFSPFFLYHGISYFVIDRFGLSLSARGCGTNICAGTPSSSSVDFLEAFGVILVLGLIFLYAALRQTREGRKDVRKLGTLFLLVILVVASFAVATSWYNGAFTPHYGVHLAGIQGDVISANGTEDSSIQLLPQGRAGGLLMNGGEFLEVLQVLNTRSIVSAILSLGFAPGESNGFKILHNPVNGSGRIQEWYIYPGVINYVPIYLQAPSSDSNYTGFTLRLYVS